MLYTGSLIAAFFITVLPGSDVGNVLTNICWHFHGNEGIFVHHVTRNGWLNSGNGSAKNFSRPFRTDISSSSYPKSSADISSMTENSSPISVVADGNHSSSFFRKPYPKRTLPLVPLLPYSRLVIFWGSTLTSTFSAQMAVFMQKACLRAPHRQACSG